MLTPTQICNIGADLLGEGFISNTFQTAPANKRERLCFQNYERLRLTMLRENIWNFAKRRASMPPAAVTPQFGYDTAYFLPPDFIRLIALGETPVWHSREKYNYSIEQHPLAVDNPLAGTARALLINKGTLDNSAFEGTSEDGETRALRITYVFNCQNSQQFDIHFANALGARMFFEFGPSLTEEQNRINRCQAAYENAIAEALSIDAMETPPIALETDEWEDVRL